VRARPITFDRLGPEDVQILKKEAGAICGHTCKVLILEPTDGRPLPTLDQLRAYIASRLGAATRLRQRLVQTPLRVARPAWFDDPEFDIARHVTRYGSGRAVDRDQLEQIVGELMSRRLKRSHPLWHIDVVERLADGTMGLIWRVHHCMADGATCMRMAGSMLWSEHPAQEPVDGPRWEPLPAPGPIGLFRAGLADRAQRRRQHRPAGERNGPSLLAAREIIRRELSRTAAATRLSQRIGTRRSVAFAQAPLEDCKRAGKAIDSHVTVNDVVLGIVAGGIRRWLAHVNGPTDGIRVKVPVSLHSDDDRLANHDSYFVVDLPIAEPDPAKRLVAINRATTQRKLDHDAETLYRLGQHPIVSRWAMSPHVFTFNVSNVRGPASDVYVLGARVRELYSLSEIAQHHALRVAVLSAGDKLSFGLCADRDAVRDLGVLADGIRSATNELLAAAAA
jgi:diacylglycerol O-acyltransferase / wax synthase